jgi:hypothetical protein
VSGQGTARYEEALAAVGAVVNRLDPMGLIGMGAPDNEYEPEVAALARLVLRPADIRVDEVEAIWNHYFGDTWADKRLIPEQVQELRHLQRRYASSA